jgi:lipopolysaccharide biosynthesis regulator YciM
LSTIAAVVLVAVLALAIYLMRRRRKRKVPVRSLYVTALEKLLGGTADEGFQDLRQEVSINPDNSRAYLLLGDLLRERGEADRAARVHKQLLVRPGLEREISNEVRLHLAEDLEAAGRWDAAEAVYREILRSAEGSEPAREGLATALEQQAKWEQALSVRQRLRGTQPRVLALILVTMGEEELDAGHFKEARARFADALRKDSTCLVARLLLGDSYRRQDKLGEAVAQWRSVLTEDRELAADAFRRLEEALFEGGRFGEMEQIYRDALESRPDDGPTVRAMASFLARKGEKREALEVCRSYLVQHPGDREVRLKLALLSRDVGDTEDALENLLELVPAEGTVGGYECPACGHRSQGLLWLCPSCREWTVYRRSR